MSSIVELHVVNGRDVPADRILKNAIGKMDKVVIAGKTKQGEFYTASSVADAREATELVKKFRDYLMNE